MPPPFRGRQQAKNVGPDGKHIPSQKAGRKGGRPRKERRVPPAGEALPARPPHVAGRPTDCDPDSMQAQAFYRAFATGIGIDDAARIAGYEPFTVRRWMEWGAGRPEAEPPVAAREPYRTFCEKAIAAEATTVQAAAGSVLDRDPLAWLKRVRRDRWAEPTQRIAVDARHSLSPETLAEMERTRHMTDEQLAEFVRERKSET